MFLPPPPPAIVAAAPAPLVIIDQSSFRLRLYTRTPTGYRKSYSYKVAVGQPQYPTPNGVFIVQHSALNPTWTAPNSPWVEEVQRGKSFPANDPKNPIVGAFIAIDTINGIGIHGTKDRASLGSRASHGCIRMTRKGAVSLFHKLPLGTPVIVQP